ncbi:MAG: DUF4003 family protein, partial [Planctomycetota bacterium]
MKPSVIHAVNPLDQFLGIYESLRGDAWWPTDQAWLRFAAQAAVMRPANPGATARAIRATAESLHLQAPWYNPLPPMLRVVVAATLVQIGEEPQAFDHTLVTTRAMFRNAGLPDTSENDILAILALRVLTNDSNINEKTVERLRAIYTSMKRHHWWLTGKDDLPSCAVMTACPGSPAAIEGAAETIYQILHARDIPADQDLQTAANMLTLAGLQPDQVTARFFDLIAALRSAGTHVDSERFCAFALLSLLDHEQQRIGVRFQEILTPLEKLEPLLVGPVDANIAADLT